MNDPIKMLEVALEELYALPESDVLLGIADILTQVISLLETK